MHSLSGVKLKKHPSVVFADSRDMPPSFCQEVTEIRYIVGDELVADNDENVAYFSTFWGSSFFRDTLTATLNKSTHSLLIVSEDMKSGKVDQKPI